MKGEGKEARLLAQIAPRVLAKYGSLDIFSLLSLCRAYKGLHESKQRNNPQHVFLEFRSRLMDMYDELYVNRRGEWGLRDGVVPRSVLLLEAEI